VIHPSQKSVVNPVPRNDAAAKALIPRLNVHDVVTWSGWVDSESGKSGGDILIEWVKGLMAEGGGDYPEAAKTALKFLMGLVGSSPPGPETLVLWYTDSSPHHLSHHGVNRLLEIAAHNPPAGSNFRPFNTQIDKKTTSSSLNQMAPHPYMAGEKTGASSHIHGESCTDWVHLCRAAKETGLRVYTVLPPSMTDADALFWAMLGTVTEGGTCTIGGKLTSHNQPAEREGVSVGHKGALESYVAGGGDFVRAVTKLSLGVVLSQLVDKSQEGGSENREVAGEREIVDNNVSHQDTEATLNGPPELEKVRWISYNPADTEQLLRTGKHKQGLFELG
jgi:hypothetical protein